VSPLGSLAPGISLERKMLRTKLIEGKRLSKDALVATTMGFVIEIPANHKKGDVNPDANPDPDPDPISATPGPGDMHGPTGSKEWGGKRSSLLSAAVCV